jgi:branched-chain amino acid transport system permease protein
MTTFLAANAPMLRTMSVLALLGYSVQVALRAGVFSFATVGFYAVGGYVTANLLKAQWDRFPTLLVVIVVGAVFAAVLTPALSRLRFLYLAMATLAFTLFIQSLAQSWPRYTGGAQGLFAIPRVLKPLEMLILVAIVVVLVWVTQRGVTGRAVTALRHDALLAAAAGVDVRRTQAVAFVASSALGAVAGYVRVASFGVFGPADIGFGVVVSALTVLVVGGAMAWIGPLLGGILVGGLPIYLSVVGAWNLVVQSVVVLVLVVYRPDGLAGVLAGLARIVARHRPRPPGAPDPEPARDPDRVEIR